MLILQGLYVPRKQRDSPFLHFSQTSNLVCAFFGADPLPAISFFLEILSSKWYIIIYHKNIIHPPAIP